MSHIWVIERKSTDNDYTPIGLVDFTWEYEDNFFTTRDEARLHKKILELTSLKDIKIKYRIVKYVRAK